jgi:hypothetical protein
MAKFYGKIGFAIQTEVRPGVWQNVITERYYSGEVIRNSVKHDGDKVNPDLSTGNSIRIVADAYANETFFAMKYLEWMGVLWSISNVDVERPRLTIRLGGVYNGAID